MLAITNTNRVGGFDGIIPFADINDGKLDLVIVKDVQSQIECTIKSWYRLVNTIRVLYPLYSRTTYSHYL